MTLAGKTLFITGASRGIGLAIGKRAAADGANVVIAAKTTEPHPKLEGTIYTAAEEIQAAGGKCLPLQLDIRDDEAIQKAVEAAADHFGGIDILINNASAIYLSPTEALEPKRYVLMHSFNLRGTFMMSRACIPYLKGSTNAHILNLSPPINLNPKCEPQLGKRGLYSALGGTSIRQAEIAMLWVLNLSDGSSSLLDIAQRAGLPFEAISAAAALLSQHDLLAPAPP